MKSLGPVRLLSNTVPIHHDAAKLFKGLYEYLYVHVYIYFKQFVEFFFFHVYSFF